MFAVPNGSALVGEFAVIQPLVLEHEGDLIQAGKDGELVSGQQVKQRLSKRLG